MVAPIQQTQALYGAEQTSRSQPLTDDQKSQVQSILSKYDPNNVTAVDAQAIFKSFRQAGIQPGASMKDAITNAGFDADKLRAASRPQGGHHHHHKAASSTDGTDGTTSTDSTTTVDKAALQSLQSILSQYDLKNLSSDSEKDLVSKLGQAGLMKTGTTIDIGA